ncbi:MAG: roadblock/LC7 domain-containing protein [Acidobacteriota bacterium]
MQESSPDRKGFARNGIRRLHSAESDKLGRVLDSLVNSCAVRSAFLVGMSGQEMVSRGAVDPLEREAVCSLAAGTMAATRSLAGLFGEETFEGVYHKGKVSSVLILPVGDEAILLLVLENSSRRDRRHSAEILQATRVLRDLLAMGTVSRED